MHARSRTHTHIYKCGLLGKGLWWTLLLIFPWSFSKMIRYVRSRAVPSKFSVSSKFRWWTFKNFVVMLLIPWIMESYIRFSCIFFMFMVYHHHLSYIFFMFMILFTYYYHHVSSLNSPTVNFRVYNGFVCMIFIFFTLYVQWFLFMSVGFLSHLQKCKGPFVKSERYFLNDWNS